MTYSAELIICIVNQGYEDMVIQSANEIGVTGGTFLGAHGISKLDTERFFGISIHPEKQVVMMVVPKEKKDAILDRLYDDVGITKGAQGIAFSIPVDDMSENLKQQLFSKKNNNKKD